MPYGEAAVVSMELLACCSEGMEEEDDVAVIGCDSTLVVGLAVGRVGRCGLC